MVDIVAIGTGGFAPFTEKMRTFMGDIPLDYHVFGASEGLFACSTMPEQKDYVLLINGGFYEFIPMDSDDVNDIVTFDKLEPGKEYEFVLTNNSGLYRYRIKDVIRCTSYYNQIPRIEFIYRKNQLVSIAGEKMTENDFNWAVAEFSKEVDNNVLDYAIYPDTDVVPGRIVVFMETEKDVDLKDNETYRQIIENKMAQVSPDFDEEIKANELSPSLLYFVEKNTNGLYRDIMIHQGTILNQIKPVRIIDSAFKKDFFFSLKDEGVNGDFTYEIKQEGNKLICAVKGIYDGEKIPQFETEIRNGLSGITQIVVCFKDVEAVTATGLRSLLVITDMIKGTKAKLINTSDSLKDLCHKTAVDEFVSVE